MSHKRSRFHNMEVQFLNAILKKNIPREFDFNHMDLSILSGISMDIKRLSVSENPAFKNHPLKDYDKFYTDETMRIRIKALPILIARISMKEMHMEKPVIHVLRNEAKQMSIDDLFKGNKGALLSWLNVDQLTVANGTLKFIDASAPRKPFVIVFDDLNAAFSGFSMNENFKVDIALKGPGAPKPNCFFNGVAGPINNASNFTQIPVNVNFRLIDEPVSPYAVYFPPGLPFPISGSISINYQVNGDSWSGLHMKGSSTIHHLVISSDDGRKKKSIPFTLGMSLEKEMIFSMKEDRVVIDNATLQMNQSHFFIDGAITRISENPEIDVTLASLSVDLDDMKNIYPFYQDYMPDNCDYSGRAGMEIHVQGDQKKIDISGQMDFTDAFLEVNGFFKKKRSKSQILDFEATTYPETKTFIGRGTIKSGAMEIFTPKWYYTFREALSQYIKAEHRTESSGTVSFPEIPVVADSLEGHVAFSDNTITLEKVSLLNCHQAVTEGVDAVVSGQVDLAKMTLHLTGEVVLSLKDSAAILSVGSGGKASVPDKKGRIHIPITITGALKEPVVRLDQTVLESR